MVKSAFFGKFCIIDRAKWCFFERFWQNCTVECALFRNIAQWRGQFFLVHGSWFMVKGSFLAEFILCFRLICFRSAQARSHKPSGFFTDDWQSRARAGLADRRTTKKEKNDIGVHFFCEKIYSLTELTRQ